MSVRLNQNLAFTTQQPTPNSSNVFLTPTKPTSTSPSLKLDSLLCTCQTSRPTTPRGQNSSQLIIQKLNESGQIRLSQRESEKNYSGLWTADSSRHNDKRGHQPTFNIKQTLRQYQEEIKELRKWFAVLRKQCSIYEETIAKMDQKIARLQQQNKAVNSQLKTTLLDKQNIEKTYEMKRIELLTTMDKKEASNKQEIKALKDRVNSIMTMYGQLESEVNKSQIQWVIWKQKWIAEKRCYVNKIEQLQEYLREGKNSQLVSARPKSYHQDIKKDENKRLYEDLINRKTQNKSINITRTYLGH